MEAANALRPRSVKRDLSLMFDGILNATLSEENVFTTGVTQELKRVTNSRAIAQKSWILIEPINMVITSQIHLLKIQLTRLVIF